MFRRGPVCLSAALSLPGCASGASHVSLASLRGDPTMTIKIEEWILSDGTHGGYVDFGAWTHSGPSNVCPALDPATVATINGRPLHALTTGVADSTNGICFDPQWDVDTADFHGPTMDVKLSDSSGTLEATFLNVDVPRTFTILSPTSGVAHVGDTVTITVSPTTDRYDDWSSPGPGVLFEDAPPTAPSYNMAPTGTNGGCTPDNCVLLDGGATAFKVPASAVNDTSLALTEWGYVGWSRCDVAHCEYDLRTVTNNVALTILP